MTRQNNRNRPPEPPAPENSRQKIVVGVAVLLIAGGTAPWWLAPIVEWLMPGRGAEIVLSGSGTDETNSVVVPVAPYARIAAIQAKATAQAAIGGQLQLVVIGTSGDCSTAKKFLSGSKADLLTTDIKCSDVIPANESKEYRARAPNEHANALSVDLNVSVRAR